MTDRNDLIRDEIAEAIRPVIQGHIARAYGVDDLGALVHEAAQAVIDALGLTPEIGRWGVEQRWVSLWREMGDD